MCRNMVVHASRQAHDDNDDDEDDGDDDGDGYFTRASAAKCSGAEIIK